MQQCPTCGKEFAVHVQRYRGTKRKQKYCCRGCYDRRGPSPVSNRLPTPERVERTCVVCENKFLPYRSDTVTCSPACQKVRTGRLHKIARVNRTVVQVKICQRCQNPFNPRIMGRRVYCSTACSLEGKLQNSRRSAERQSEEKKNRIRIRNRQRYQEDKQCQRSA